MIVSETMLAPSREGHPSCQQVRNHDLLRHATVELRTRPRRRADSQGRYLARAPASHSDYVDLADHAVSDILDGTYPAARSGPTSKRSCSTRTGTTSTRSRFTRRGTTSPRSRSASTCTTSTRGCATRTGANDGQLHASSRCPRQNPINKGR